MRRDPTHVRPQTGLRIRGLRLLLLLGLRDRASCGSADSSRGRDRTLTWQPRGQRRLGDVEIVNGSFRDAGGADHLYRGQEHRRHSLTVRSARRPHVLGNRWWFALNTGRQHRVPAANQTSMAEC